jgi:hypothetical protein
MGEGAKSKREKYLNNLFANTVGSKTNLLQKHFNNDITTMYFSMQEEALRSQGRPIGSPVNLGSPMGRKYETTGGSDRASDTQPDYGGGRITEEHVVPLSSVRNPRVDLQVKSTTYS